MEDLLSASDNLATDFSRALVQPKIQITLRTICIPYRVFIVLTDIFLKATNFNYE